MDLPRLMISLLVSYLIQPLGMLQGAGELFSFSCLMALLAVLAVLYLKVYDNMP